MARFKEIPPEQMTEEQRAVCAQMVAGIRGRVPPPFQALLPSPTLCGHAQALGEFLRYKTSLPPRLSELAILVTGRFWTAQYEWHVHAQMAEKGGLDPKIIAAIAERRDPTALMKDDERAVYAFARALHENHKVDDATYGSAVKQLSERGTVELVGLLGYYTLISMTLNVFQVPVPGGALPLAE
jgi:4-carboxymuconolactone decarboxylase